MAPVRVGLVLALVFLLLDTPPSSRASSTCNDGVLVTYNYTGGFAIPPFVRDPAIQPYRFESRVTLLNRAPYEIDSWRLFVGFQHGEILVSADTAVLADGTSLPAKVGDGGGAVLAGFPVTDLKTAVETAGDVGQMEATVQLLGTQFGVGPPTVPLPSNMSIVNDGYSCLNYSMQGNTTMEMCCVRVTSPSDADPALGTDFLPRQDGDLTIMYDVIKPYDSFYWAQVTISNDNPIGRLNNWQLTWQWMRGEFIYAMKGAYPINVDTSECIFGQQGLFYKDLDFSAAMNCERMPTIVDLPPTRANDANIGSIPFCCRNGTLLPPFMDKSQTKSAFQMQIYKMQPDLNRTALFPPQNWKINGTMSSSYLCGPPIRVKQSEFPDNSGLQSETSAVASWQIGCNITTPKPKPKCCVSLSAFYNETAVPCSTCACGCDHARNEQCSAATPALAVRPDMLLRPFENRTILARDWAITNHLSVPNPLPCGDGCPISVNWHLLSDFHDGWTARMTIFNWGDNDFSDWSAAVQLEKAGSGFQKAYSFNSTVWTDHNGTILMQGLPSFNYLLAEKDGKNPRKDFRIPGSQQSIIMFTKKGITSLNLAKGEGFPTRVWFNGEECSLPDIIPSKASVTGIGKFTATINNLLVFVLLILLQ